MNQPLPPPIAGTDLEPPAATAARRYNRRIDLEVGLVGFLVGAATTVLLVLL